MPKPDARQQKTTVFPLNPAQKAAAEAPVSPLLIVAGAGTGKTRTLTSRVVHLINTGTPPDRICAITFTNKASKEMARRIAVPGPLICTFHSLGARILRKECRAFGRGPNFVIFDDHDSGEIIKKIVKASFPKEKGNKKFSPAFFSGKISEIKNLGAIVENARMSPEEISTIHAFFVKYESMLRENNAFDFDDLIQKPVELFKNDPAALLRYQNKFDAILVDEYQDINPKQYELVKFLAGGHKNISVVGDDEQTIYSWRYADIRTFLGFEKDWPNAKVYFLEENYRSTANIINAASSVAQENQFRTPKKLWTANPAGELISLFEAWGENDEAEWIASEIEKLRVKSPSNEITILYRTNAQSRPIEQALIRRTIPYQIFGGLKFYERREVKDAVAALRWASNDRDGVAKERLEKNLTKRKFAIFREKLATLKDAKPLAILKLFIETFGYFEYLEENFLNADEREENVSELLSFATAFEDLTELLERIALLQATDDIGEDAKNKVNLMTIHMAKGLEFENVFIAGAAEGLLPHIRSIDSEASIEEERRLMYVAMTRAKKDLRISFYGMPSRFIAEIPEGSLKLISSASEEDDARIEGSDDQTYEENVVEL